MQTSYSTILFDTDPVWNVVGRALQLRECISTFQFPCCSRCRLRSYNRIQQAITMRFLTLNEFSGVDERVLLTDGWSINQNLFLPDL